MLTSHPEEIHSWYGERPMSCILLNGEEVKTSREAGVVTCVVCKNGYSDSKMEKHND